MTLARRFKKYRQGSKRLLLFRKIAFLDGLTVFARLLPSIAFILFSYSPIFSLFSSNRLSKKEKKNKNKDLGLDGLKSQPSINRQTVIFGLRHG